MNFKKMFRNLFAEKIIKFKGVCPNCHNIIYTDENDNRVFGDMHIKGFNVDYIAYTTCNKCGAKVYLSETEDDKPKNFETTDIIEKSTDNFDKYDVKMTLEEIAELFYHVWNPEKFKTRFMTQESQTVVDGIELVIAVEFENRLYYQIIQVGKWEDITHLSATRRIVQDKIKRLYNTLPKKALNCEPLEHLLK